MMLNQNVIYKKYILQYYNIYSYIYMNNNKKYILTLNNKEISNELNNEMDAIANNSKEIQIQLLCMILYIKLYIFTILIL